jgi:hypothetical protein
MPMPTAHEPGPEEEAELAARIAAMRALKRGIAPVHGKDRRVVEAFDRLEGDMAIGERDGSYVGVRRLGGRPSAQISVRGKVRHLGFFGSDEEAARAWDAASVLQGRGAKNFPGEPIPAALEGRIREWLDKWGPAPSEAGADGSQPGQEPREGPDEADEVEAELAAMRAVARALAGLRADQVASVLRWASGRLGVSI